MRCRCLTKRETTYFLLYLTIITVGSVEVISLFGPETIYNGYSLTVQSRVLENCSEFGAGIGRGMFSWYLVCLSDDLGNSRAIPFLFSLGLIPASFFFIQAATKSDTAAILSTIGLVINPVYLIFNDSAAYHQFWAFFTITSFYLGYRKPILAVPVLFLGIMCKPAALLFVPVLGAVLFPHKKALLSLGIMSGLVLLYVMFGGTSLVQGYVTPPDPAAPGEVFWAVTKHTTPLLLIPLAISLVYWQHRLSLMLLLSTMSYIGAASFTSASIFPYHTIPFFVILNGCIASFILQIFRVPKALSIIQNRS